MGNAVAPPVAAALGRCLLLAAAGAAPPGHAVVAVPDAEYESLAAGCRARGVTSYAEQAGVTLVRGRGGGVSFGVGGPVGGGVVLIVGGRLL